MMKKILIIEDHAETVEALKKLLLMKGFDVIAAYDGLKGLQTAISEKPDLILLDIMLPEMNGIEVLKKLRAGTETEKIPVVIISVKCADDDIKKGKEAGADDYLLKPFEPAKLIGTINKYLG